MFVGLTEITDPNKLRTYAAWCTKRANAAEVLGNIRLWDILDMQAHDARAEAQQIEIQTESNPKQTDNVVSIVASPRRQAAPTPTASPTQTAKRLPRAAIG